MKHCAGFPRGDSLLSENGGIGIEDVEHIGISRDPSAHLHKKILFAARRAAKQAAGGRRQTAGAVGRGGVRLRQDLIRKQTSTTSSLVSESNSGWQPGERMEMATAGIFAQVKDRLGNAAKVRDLKDDLAKALGVSKNSLQGAVS